MHCENCGTLVTGKEDKCPGCGMSIKNQIARKRERLKETLQMPIVEESTDKKETNKMKTVGLILLVIGLITLFIAVILQVNYLNNKGDISYEYKGFVFKIPKNYDITEDNNYGIILKSKDIIYTIDIDSYYNYQYYQTEYKKYYTEIIKNEEKANNLITTNQDREYILNSIPRGEYNAAEYATGIKHYTFTGLIVKKDYSKVESKDLDNLTNILSKIKEKNPKESEYHGTEINRYSFDPQDFTFGE